MKLWLLVVLLLAALALPGAEDAGKIMRPADRSALPSDQVDIAATAPKGRLQLDGKPVEAEQPFPDVFHARVKAAPGLHALTLLWDGGKQEVRFFTGPDPPAGFQAFRQHPPLADVACAQCHELSKRGRFRFKGGCFDCHRASAFAKPHTHQPDVLKECGMCHNAHGSTAKAHLLQSKEAACKLCHA